jgi:hypothetical protein
VAGPPGAELDRFTYLPLVLHSLSDAAVR